MSHVIRTCLCHIRTKGADKPAHPCSLITAISAFVVRCLDSVICILAMSKILRLASLYSWAGRFESYLVANPRRQVFLWWGSFTCCITDIALGRYIGPSLVLQMHMTSLSMRLEKSFCQKFSPRSISCVCKQQRALVDCVAALAQQPLYRLLWAITVHLYKSQIMGKPVYAICEQLIRAV